MKKLLGVLFVFLLVLVLAGCTPKDGDAAKKKLEKKDYTVEVLKGDNSISRATIEAIAKDAEEVVGFSKKTDDGGRIAGTAILFESAKAAKEFYNDHKDDKSEGEKVLLLGKWVVGGDEQAVKDFK